MGKHVCNRDKYLTKGLNLFKFSLSYFARMVTAPSQQDSPYRQMELEAHTVDGELHSPEKVKEQAVRARKQAEYYEQQSQQWETQSRELELSNRQKARFNADLNEIGTKIHNSVRRIERELESMDREHREMEQICGCFKRHLQILSSLQPQQWKPENVTENLRESLPKIDRAENDFLEAYACGRKYQHTDIFIHKPGEEERDGLTWKNLRELMLKGLAFHIPLFILILLSWMAYSLISHT